MSPYECSVVIITRNRAMELSHCLASLLSQSISPGEVLIINNSSTDTTKETIKQFQKKTNITLRSIIESKVGYTFARNKGIKEAKNSWIVFIDDDCIADYQWLERIQNRINKNGSHQQALVGRTDTYYPGNVFATTSNLIQNFWKKNRIQKNVVTDLEILDTKNLALNRSFLVQEKIQYATNNFKNGASEDCDFGMQLEEKGGKSEYIDDAVVYHKDPTTFKIYWKKLINSALAHNGFEKKWGGYRKKHHKKNYYFHFKTFFLNLVREKNYSLIFSIQLLALVTCSFFVIKTIKFFRS